MFNDDDKDDYVKLCTRLTVQVGFL